MILDLSILFIGLFIFLFLKAINRPFEQVAPIKGSKVIVKAKPNIIIHVGTLDHLDGDCAICYRNDGAMFVAWASHLFWSEGEQAFVEKV